MVKAWPYGLTNRNVMRSLSPMASYLARSNLGSTGAPPAEELRTGGVIAGWCLAVGSICLLSARLTEGWKDMDSYMREFKIEGTPSVFTQKPAEHRSRADRESVETESRDRS